MRYRPDREFSILNIEDVQHQENQYDNNILTSVKSALYRLNTLPNCIGYIEIDIYGIMLFAPLSLSGC
jgi:hypothetical protein